MPLLSVICPVFRVEHYLRDCIESILNQSFQDFELILVDDGSPDNSGRICDEYAQGDARIKVIHKHNGGLSSARNCALDMAEGKYLSFIDSDDCLLDCDTYLQNIQILQSDSQIDMVVFPYLYPYGTSQKGNMRIAPIGYVSDKEKLLSYYISDNSQCINHAMWNKIFRKEVFNNIRFPEGQVFEDTYIIPEVVDTVCKVYCSDKGCYGYRLAGDSIMTSQDTYKKYHDRILAYTKLLEFSMQYPNLLLLSYIIYSRLFFYYLGMERQYGNETHDRKLSSAIDVCNSLSFPWKIVFKHQDTFKHKCYLVAVKILGYKNTVKLLLKRNG